MFKKVYILKHIQKIYKKEFEQLKTRYPKTLRIKHDFFKILLNFFPNFICELCYTHPKLLGNFFKIFLKFYLKLLKVCRTIPEKFSKFPQNYWKISPNFFLKPFLCTFCTICKDHISYSN